MARRIYSLFNDFEYTGFWWLPDDPEHKVSGILTYKSGDQITLKLIGSLRRSADPRRPELEEEEVVLGLAEGTRLCTLTKLIHVNASFTREGGVYRSKYIVHHLFEGKHFHSPEQIQFHSASVSYTSFEEWIAEIPYDEDSEQSEDEGSITFIARHKHPNQIFSTEVQSLSATVSADLMISGSYGLRTLKWKSTGYINITPASAQSFDWFWGVIVDLRNLLTLFMNEPTYPRHIRASGEELETRPGHTSRETIHIYYAHSANDVDRKVSPSDMLITAPDIKDRIGNILDAWFTNKAALQSVYDLFFGTMFFRRMYNRFHFLNLAQAVESFHREMRPGTTVSPEEFSKFSKPLRDAIPAEAPTELRQSFDSLISIANSHSFKKRIKLLFEELEDRTRRLIAEDEDGFITRVVKTRNYFTHHAESLRRRAFSDEQLHFAN